jgi:glycosyltransferase 2 family protein
LKRNIFRVINFFLFLSIGLILLYFAFRGIKIESLIHDLKSANYAWVGLSLVFAFFAYLSRAYRWKLLIEPLGYKPSFKNVYHAVMLGYIANLAFPRIGEITRCGSLTKTDKIPIDSLIGTVIIERAIDLFVLLIFLFFIFLAKIEYFGNFIKENVFIPIYHKFINIVDFPFYYWFIVIFLIAIGILLYYYFRKRLKRVKIIHKFRKLLRGVITGVKTVTKMRNRWDFLLHTVIIWTMYFLMTYVVIFAIPATQNLTPIDAVFLLVIGGLGMAAPVQGGIGAFHWIIASGLTLYDIPKTDGLVFATIQHESQVFLVLVLGIISLLSLFIYSRRQNKINR